MLFGAALIVASFFSAYLISQSANRMVTVWSAAVDLAPGTVIGAGDIVATRVLLPENAEFYLDSTSPIIGSYVLRSLGSSELIPAYALSETVFEPFQQVPLSIPRSRAPFGITSGDIVDVYAFPREQFGAGDSGSNAKAKLILAGASIDGIDFEASKLGGEMGITLLVPIAQVAQFVSVMTDSEFVLVKSQ